MLEPSQVDTAEGTVTHATCQSEAYATHHSNLYWML